MRRVADNNVNKKLFSRYIIFRDHIFSAKLALRVTLYSLLELFETPPFQSWRSLYWKLCRLWLWKIVCILNTLFFCVWISAVILILSTKENYISNFKAWILPQHVFPQFGAADIPETLVFMHHSKGRVPSQSKLKCYLDMCVPVCTGCFWKNVPYVVITFLR